VSITKDAIAILGVCLDEKLSTMRKDSFGVDSEMKKKLTPADKIIDRIKWDVNLNKEDFVVA